jgi:hypothetical protein
MKNIKNTEHKPSNMGSKTNQILYIKKEGTYMLKIMQASII